MQFAQAAVTDIVAASKEGESEGFARRAKPLKQPCKGIDLQPTAK